MDHILPAELECRIFAIAASTWPTRIPDLMRVAQRVKVWIEPLLYRIIFLYHRPAVVDDLKLPKFSVDILRRAISQHPPDFFKNTTQHLFLGHPTSGPLLSSEFLDTLFTVCSNVTSVFLLWTLQPANIPALASLPSLRRLALDIKVGMSGIPDPLIHRLFRNITHLEVLDFPVEHAALSLSQLPNLTHFAFNPSRSGTPESDTTTLWCSVLPSCACVHLKCIVFLSMGATGDLSRVSALK
ncbi:hypothetical protein FB45DRAFT_46137 [Roridomyces roridus]|uniref:F-box domain-containing protein n=1 Tax=Roridomyces roridus TaxID=1738132 RepID=A0AAD7FKA5_9AGAR|nr:hypothetical protein FB45DRAFT_46137 [Roridomyces roridus]